jgi:hypothetical protein
VDENGIPINQKNIKEAVLRRNWERFFVGILPGSEWKEKK